MLKIYFAGSIRGGRRDASLYLSLIDRIRETDTVLTEQVGDLSRSVLEQSRDRDGQIYDKDTYCLREADVVIAECTVPSLGVGYEIGYAEARNIPVYVLYRPKDTQLSAMLKGNPNVRLRPYDTEAEAEAIVDGILEECRKEKAE